MNYQNFDVQLSDLSASKKNFASILSLYLFSLGIIFLGYSFYLLLESIGIIEEYYFLERSRALMVCCIILCLYIYSIFTDRVLCSI